MKNKYILIIFAFVIIFSGCKKKGYIDVLNADYWIMNNKAPFKVQFYLDVRYQPDEISYHWDFGDGTTSEDKEPLHSFTHTGVYNVKVQIVNYKTTIEKSFVIDVSKDPMPIKADFDAESTHGKYFAPSEIAFYNKTQYASEFFWDFGDGRGSSEDSPLHIYDTAATYTVRLYAFSNGDTGISVMQMPIEQPPDIINIDVVNVWLPEMYTGGEFELHYFTDNYEETPAGLDPVIASDMPFGWILEEPLYYFDGNYDSRALYFEIWDVNDHSNAVYTFGSKFKDIQDNFYPDTLSWDAGNGYAAEVLVSYEHSQKK